MPYWRPLVASSPEVLDWRGVGVVSRVPPPAPGHVVGREVVVLHRFRCSAAPLCTEKHSLINFAMHFLQEQHLHSECSHGSYAHGNVPWPWPSNWKLSPKHADSPAFIATGILKLRFFMTSRSLLHMTLHKLAAYAAWARCAVKKNPHAAFSICIWDVGFAFAKGKNNRSRHTLVFACRASWLFTGQSLLSTRSSWIRERERASILTFWDCPESQLMTYDTYINVRSFGSRGRLADNSIGQSEHVDNTW